MCVLDLWKYDRVVRNNNSSSALFYGIKFDELCFHFYYRTWDLGNKICEIYHSRENVFVKNPKVLNP